MNNTLSYPAVLTPDTEDGGFVVTFPNIPEAITQGDSLEEALREAADCLDEATAGRMRLEQTSPKPSVLQDGQYLIDVPAQTAIKALLYEELRTVNISKAELARRIGCNEKKVRHMLDPRYTLKLPRLEAALRTLGRKIVVTTQQFGPV